MWLAADRGLGPAPRGRLHCAARLASCEMLSLTSKEELQRCDEAEN
jgi:hypothetical protein